MGWFWATAPQSSVLEANTKDIVSKCPVKHDTSTADADVSGCPVQYKNSPFCIPPSSQEGRAAESIQPTEKLRSSISKLNPLNYMFSSLSQSRAPGQTVDLSVERELSSIPRGESGAGNWEYPSPQQMYNAMLRKGYTDTPQDAVESMVAVHNFLNEGAWMEIVNWERIFANGLKNGWNQCKRGEMNLAIDSAHAEKNGISTNNDPPRLIRFMGRPQDRTPKASILQALGWLYPTKFGCEPPFDRHDWYVLRQTPYGPKEVRYVIDYYSGEPEPTGEPVFYLDIRPAIDNPVAAAERLIRCGGDFWWRASGGAAREQNYNARQ